MKLAIHTDPGRDNRGHYDELVARWPEEEQGGIPQYHTIRYLKVW